MPPRSLVLLGAVVGAFGVAVPYYKGAGFLDHRLIVAYACLPIIFAAPAAISALTSPEGSSPPQPPTPFQTMPRVWLLCWAFGIGIFGLGLFTINLAYAHRRLLLPRTGFLVAALCLGFSGSAAAVALAAELMRHFAPRTVQTVFRTAFLIVIAALFIADRYLAVSLSTTAWTRLLFIAAAACGGAAVVCAAHFSRCTVS